MQFLNMMNRLQTLIDLLLPSGDIIVGDAGGNAAAVTMSGDTTIDNVGAVTIADNAVTTAKIIDAAITADKIGVGAVGNAKIFNDAVTPAKTLRIKTFLVAASDADADTIAMADFICDGTADEAQIVSALNSLPSTGGRVLLSEGKFEINARILEASDNVHIEGSGIESTILHQSNDTFTNAIFQFNGDRCSVSNMTIDGDDTTHTTANNDAIMFFTSNNSYVYNVRCTDNPRNGIQFNTSTDGLVYACEIDNTGAGGHGIRPDTSSHNCRIIGNFIHDTTNMGIHKGDTGGVSNRVVIIGNLFSNTGFEAINVKDGIGHIIDGNNIDTTGDACIVVFDGASDFIVSNNIGTTAQAAGISLGIDAGCNDFIIANNVMKNNNQVAASFSGINLNNACTGFILSGNRCYDDQGTKTQAFGIELVSSAFDNFMIVNNNLIGNDTGAMDINVTGSPERIIANNLGDISRQQPMKVTMFYNSGGTVWTNMPATITELFGDATNKEACDLTNVKECRMQVQVITAGTAASFLQPQFATTDLALTATNLNVVLTNTGLIDSGFQPIAAAAQGLVTLRIIGDDGDAMDDPSIQKITLEFR